MLTLAVALFIFVGVYAVLKAVLAHVATLASVVEPLSIVGGVIASLIYLGAIR